MSEPFRRFAFAATREGALGLAILALFAAVALLAPWLSASDPLDPVDVPLLPLDLFSPHPLGTDRLGRDILAELAYGARSSLLIMALTVMSASVVGSALGAIAGYRGGLIDAVVMRIADALQTIPPLLFVMAVVAATGPHLISFVFALTLNAWTLPARVVRAEVISLKQADYVSASRLLGRSPLAVALRVVLPNALTAVTALTAILAGNALLAEAALAFLGFADPNTASWGAMIAEGRAVMRTHPHVLAVPGLALALAILAVALIGEGLARARDETFR